MGVRNGLAGWVACLAAAGVLAWAGPAWGADDLAGYPRLMQEPMLGAVDEDSVRVWLRASGPFEVRVEVSRDEMFTESVLTEPVVATKADDYCVTVVVDGLEAGTRYSYRVLVAGEVDRYQRARRPLSFETEPAGEAKFRVAFGSCARYQLDKDQPIWPVVAEWEPDLFFWLGDNIYGDAQDPDILAEEYRRQRSVSSMRTLMGTLPQLATWDDHDFGINNLDRTHPGKASALEVFKRYWANPSYGQPKTAGVFFSYEYGGVDFFFLDGRYHRSPNSVPDGPGKTMLGAAQLAWLKWELERSDAPFKVLVSGSGFNTAKGPTGDSWSAFLHERDALFDFIADQEINGVVLLSGDTHTGELNRIPWSERGGYDFYEFVSSPLAQIPSRRSRELYRGEERIHPQFRASANVGMVDFDLTVEDPTVTFTLVDEHGRAPWRPFVVRASELRVPESR